jgi:hypothetical protein
LSSIYKGKKLRRTGIPEQRKNITNSTEEINLSPFLFISSSRKDKKKDKKQ